MGIAVPHGSFFSLSLFLFLFSFPSSSPTLSTGSHVIQASLKQYSPSQMRLDLGRMGDPEFSSPFFTSVDAVSKTYL